MRFMDEGESTMDIMIGLVFTAVVLTVIVLIAQRFLFTINSIHYAYIMVRDNREDSALDAIKQGAAAFETTKYPDAYVNSLSQGGGACCGGGSAG
jgi:uncharacterized membrane protein